jgi:co-chaperonin GroES (HSP10)
MRSTRYIIIEAEETHKKKDGSIEILERFENQEKVNQFQKVVSVPKRFEGKFEEGDTICIHFNVLRYERKNGVKTMSPNYIRDNFYYIPDHQAHFVIKKDGSLFFFKQDCLIEGRIGREEVITSFGIILPDLRKENEKKADIMDGIIYAKGDDMDDVEVGDKVCMNKYSDYSIVFPDGKTRWLVGYNSLLFAYDQ